MSRAVALLAIGAPACRPPAGQGAVQPPVAAAAMPAPFSPGTAHPARKARLIALAPRLDDHFRAKLAEAGATGAVAGIVIEGELVYARGFGVRDVESSAAVDLDTVFRIASVSKSFTAAAVLKLRDEGRLRLDAPAKDYLPELESVAGPTRDAPAINLRHLLTMASGLPYDDMWGAVTFGYDDAQLSRFLAAGVTLASAPGERYAYSNLGYALLGKVVERVSGMKFRDYVSTNLLLPLGMTATSWATDNAAPPRLAIGYRRDGQRDGRPGEPERLIVEPRPADGVFDAAGGLYTSLRDYARYAAFQLAAYPPRDDPPSGPLRRSTVREMHQGQRWGRWRGDAVPVVGRTPEGKTVLSAAGYGFGWLNNTTCASEGIVQHGGYEPGYFATVHLLPNAGVGIVVLATTGPVGWRSIDGTLALLGEAGLLAPTPPIAPTPALAAARDTASRLLERWDADLVARSFDDHSLRYAWLASLRDDLAKLGREHGQCRPQGPITALDRTRGTFRAACDRGSIELTVLLTPAVPPRIQMLQWRDAESAATRSHAICAE